MISCVNYDYVEIVCLFKYPVELTMKSGDVICGDPLDTVKNSAREECLKINVDGNEELVVLESVAKLKVLVDNPHFTEVSLE